MLDELSKRRLRHRRPIRIAVTGGLASGKSTALKAFKEAGYLIASADQMVESIYQAQNVSKAELLRRFSTTKAGLKKLEAWIHPQVKKQVSAFLKSARRPSIVEIPLLFEAGMQNQFDFVIFSFCPKAVRAKRALRRGMNLKLFNALDQRQWSSFEKARASDFVLHNWDKKKFKARAKNLAAMLK